VSDRDFDIPDLFNLSVIVHDAIEVRENVVHADRPSTEDVQPFTFRELWSGCTHK